MKKKTKKVARRATAAALCLSMLGVGASLAYLTDSEATTNTFTAGAVQIDLLEEAWDTANGKNDTDENGVPDFAENLVPNQIVAKNPKVENTGLNDAIVYLQVTSPKKEITVCDSDGTKGDRKIQELFCFQTEDFNAHGVNAWDEDDWMELKSREKEDDTVKTYLFGYKTKLAPGASTYTLFDQVELKNLIEGDMDGGEIADIEVTAFAIQADNVLNVDGVIDVDADLGEYDEDTLLYAYDTLLNQDTYGFGSFEHPNDPFKQAEAWGKYDLNRNQINDDIGTVEP